MTPVPTPDDEVRTVPVDGSAPEYAAADVLIEDVSIDGMCGVY